MKFFKLAVLNLLVFIAGTSVVKADSIASFYRDSQFHTHYQSGVTVDVSVAKDVAGSLISDFHNRPAHLFDWALKDLGLQNSKNEIIIVFKSSTDDRKTNITHGVFDIVVPHITTFRNVKVDAVVTPRNEKNSFLVEADIIYSSLLLKQATGIIRFVPESGQKIKIITDVNITFGWFFNIFITQRRYKSIVEWRIKKFTENIIDECNFRAKKEKHDETSSK